jgi:hypothetical protein
VFSISFDSPSLSGTAISTSSSPTFAGNTVSVTTTATQTITASITAGFDGNGASGEIFYGLCYNAGSGTPTGFPETDAGSPIFTQTSQLSGWFPASASATIVPGVGTWTVGLCTESELSGGGTPGLLSETGWVMVTGE